MSEAARKEVAPTAGAQIIQADASSLMEVISRAASDPATDVDKLERLLGMYERITAQKAKAAFTTAMLEMQPKLPVITENGGIKDNAGKIQSTYAKWEDINDAILPHLSQHGFALSFRPGVAPDGKQTVTAVLRHRDGHDDEATVTLPYDSSGSKNSVQAVGSSLSYGKRYSAIAVLNLTSRAKDDRDDDGRGAGLSEIAQKATTEINMADTLDELRAWKNAKFDGVMKMLNSNEGREIVALYNRRSKSFRAQAAGAADFPGDRK